MISRIKNIFAGKNNLESGYIALVSTIILSLILVALIITTGASGLITRTDVLNLEYKRISLGLAESCLNSALLKIAQDYEYSGNEILDVQDTPPVQTCKINPITYGEEDENHQKLATIVAEGEFNGAYSKMQATALIGNPNLAPIVKANLTVITQVVNNYGGTKKPSDFTVNITGGSPNPNSFLGSNSGVFVLLNPGTFGVSQSGATGYTQSTSGNCQGSIISSTPLTCTIVERDNPATSTLTVVANVVNDDGGTSLPSDFSLSIDGTSQASGSPRSGLTPGSHTVAADEVEGYAVSDWSPECAGGNVTLTSGNSTTCTVTYDDAEPPTPACADTLMMLDRTGSMSYSDLNGEKTAANGLIDLYSPILPAPKVSVGVFGAVGASEPYNAAVTQGLTTNYTNLHSAVNNGLSSSGGYTNLSSAIDKGQAELASYGSSNEDGSPFPRVLILLSDGGANRPCTSNCGSSANSTATSAATASADAAKAAGTNIFTIHYGSAGSNNSDQNFLATLANNSANDHFSLGETNFLSPSANSQNSSGNLWSNPANTYSNSNGAASDPVSENNSHRFYNFNVPSLSNYTVNGIEVRADAWASGVSLDTGYKNPTSQASDTGGDNNGFETNPTNAYTDGSGYATNNNGSGDRHRFYGYDFSGIPAGTSITGIEARLDWWANSTSGTNYMNVELSWDGGNTWTGAKTENTETTTDSNNKILGNLYDDWGHSWSLSDLSSANFRVRVTSGSSSGSRDFYLDWVPIKIYYTNTINPGCKIGIDLSWNGGSTWTTQKQQSLNGSESAYYLGGSADNWGRSWSSGDFSNSNLRLRVQAIDPDSGSDAICTDSAIINLDWVEIKVHYTGSSIDADAENADGDNFYISPTANDMADIFADIGREVCPATVPPPPPSNRATLIVITHVINDNGGVSVPGDFTMNISAVNPTQISFDGADSPGVVVSVDAGSYSIDEGSTGAYSKSLGPNCSGTITAGAVLTCTIINDDLEPTASPPSPSGSSSEIIINSWSEQP